MAMRGTLMIKDFYIKQEIKTVYNNKGVESVHLSLTIKCSKDDFIKSVKQVAKDLNADDLKAVDSISISLKKSD
jgi:hypothetical protein